MPASHGAHTVLFVDPWYVPTAQLVHTDSPVVAEYFPTTHHEHDIMTVAPAYVPTGQLVHADVHTVAHVIA